MAPGANEAIGSILSLVQEYFPAILGVVAGMTALTAVINFIRSAG